MISKYSRYCRCGHDRSLHEHYRRGTDCARRGCDCPRYRRRWVKPGTKLWALLWLWSLHRDLR